MIWIIGSRGIPARYGGFETLAEHLDRGFRERGLDCCVIGTTDVNEAHPRLNRLLLRLGLQAAFTPVMTWVGRPRVRPGDSVLVLNPVNIRTARWLRRRGAHVVLHMDGMEHLRRKWGPVQRAVHRIARRSAVRSTLPLIADSHEIERIFLEENGRETVYIAYGGCDAAEADPTHRRSPDRADSYFVVLARSEPENQVLEICEAFAAADVDARLVVVGGPSRKADYWRRMELVAASNPGIELLGPVFDRGRLCDLMLGARAYIHGHTVGGTNPSLVDALSHGTPVLAHDNAFNREVLAGSGTLWASPADLTRALREGSPPPRPAALPPELRWSHVVDRYMLVLLDEKCCSDSRLGEGS